MNWNEYGNKIKIDVKHIKKKYIVSFIDAFLLTSNVEGQYVSSEIICIYLYRKINFLNIHVSLKLVQ